jgi:hypothetical protein
MDGPDMDRRRMLAVGGVALSVGLAGCGLFDDSTLPETDEVDGDTGEGETDEDGPLGPEPEN